MTKETSPLVEQLIRFCKDMVSVLGLVEVATLRLHEWFNGMDGMAKAYNFFVRKVGVWPWKPLIWKSCILPKHGFIL